MAIDLRTGATQLVKWGSEPALATRVSIPNVNLLSTKGSILYGTGNPAPIEASINGTTYQYAEVKALAAPSGTEQFILSNDSDGNLRYVPVINDYTDYGSRLGVLSASVANDINQKLHIANAARGTGISMGDRASGINAGAIAIGNDANATAAFGEDGSFAIAIGSNARADNKNIAIGSKAIASSYAFPAIQLGAGENHTPKSFQVWNTPMLVDGKIPFETLSPAKNGDVGLVLSNGQTGKIMSYDGTVVLGPQAVVTGQDGIAIGAQAVASGNSIAIGGDAVSASSGGIAIGVRAVANTKGIAIGSTASAAQNGIAIGDLATANNETIQLGYNGDVDKDGYFKDNETGKYSLRIGRYILMGNDGKIGISRLNVVKMAFGIFSLTVTVKPVDSSTSQATAYITLSLVYKKPNDYMDVARLKRIISDSTSNRKSFICNGTINFGGAHYLIADAWVANDKFYFGIPQGTTYEETSTTSSILNDFGDIYVFNTLDVK